MSQLHEYKAELHKKIKPLSPTVGTMFSKRGPESITTEEPFLVDNIAYFMSERDERLSLHQIKEYYGNGDIVVPTEYSQIKFLLPIIF